MPNRFNPDTQVIWDLTNDGWTAKAIAEENGWSLHKVAAAVGRGRDRGVIARPQYMTSVDHRRRFGGIRRGSIKNVMDGLSEDRQEWLVSNAFEQGYDSLAEYVLDLVMDVYDAEYGEYQ